MDAKKTAQQIESAAYDLQGMEVELRMPTKLFVLGTLTENKARLSYLAINRFLLDNGNLTKLADDKDFGKLPAIAQAEAGWLDKFMTDLMRLDPLLDKAWKMARKSPEGQDAKILKHAKLCLAETRTKPKTLAGLVKRLVQGNQPEPLEAPIIGFLPLAIICWAVADQVDDAMAKRPR